MVTRGQKRHLVTLQGAGPLVPDGDGGYTQTRVNLDPATAYAEIKPATARDLERTIANVVQSKASHIVTIDYHSGVTTETTLLFNDAKLGRLRTFQVAGVQNPDEKSKDIVLACEELVP